MPDRSLESLSSVFRPLACELIARIVARGVAVMIVQTGRSEAEQEANLAAGTSATRHSKHLPRRLRGFGPVNADQAMWAQASQSRDLEKADAIDLCPFATYQLHGADKLQWDVTDPAWLVIGEEAEKLGLRWGGRWVHPCDPGHAELIVPADHDRLALELARPWPPPALTRA